MIALRRFLTLLCCVISFGVSAGEEPGKGSLLVATELLGGPAFSETVILILQYDASGTLGLVVNRPTEIAAAEALPELGQVEKYEGLLYFGGPVQLHTLRAVLATGTPPADAEKIFGNVYLARPTEELLNRELDSSHLRFYIGYAGWAPGQLEQEMADGSWRVVAATKQLVFSDHPKEIWRRLAPREVLRASR